MAVVPGSHKTGLVPHCPAKPELKHVHILEERLGGDAIPVPLKPGDVLFMHKLTMHCSLPNKSDDIRWSFDLRYNPTGQATGRPWFPGLRGPQQGQPRLRPYRPRRMGIPLGARRRGPCQRPDPRL